MPIQFYYHLHVFAIIAFAGCSFAACAAPTPDRRKMILKLSGIAAVLALIAGFGLQAKLQLGFPGWLVVKVICWVALGALAGMPFRQPERTRQWTYVFLGLVFIALAMVYWKPF